MIDLIAQWTYGLQDNGVKRRVPLIYLASDWLWQGPHHQGMPGTRLSYDLTGRRGLV